MNWNKRKHTAFALTSSAVSDGGRFTRQFFRGTRATSAVAEGFLGAIVRRYGMNRKRRDCVIFKTRRSKGLDKSQHRTPPDQLDSAIKCPPECSSPSRPAAKHPDRGLFRSASRGHTLVQIWLSGSPACQTRFFRDATRFCRRGSPPDDYCVVRSPSFSPTEGGFNQPLSPSTHTFFPADGLSGPSLSSSHHGFASIPRAR